MVHTVSTKIARASGLSIRESILLSLSMPIVEGFLNSAWLDIEFRRTFVSDIKSRSQQRTLQLIKESPWQFKIEAYESWNPFLGLKKAVFGDEWIFIPKSVFSNPHILADLLIQLYVLQIGFTGHPTNEYSVAKTLSRLFWKWNWK